MRSGFAAGEGGELNVFPLQVEPLFDAHPKVRRSGLVGVPGTAGELPVLCVEVEPDVGKDQLPDLHRELLARAADFDMANKIHAILFKDALPVDPRHNSKIERPRALQVGRSAVVGTVLPQPANQPSRRNPPCRRNLNLAPAKSRCARRCWAR